MARTQTFSATRTYPRMNLLKAQVAIALRRAVRPGDLSDSGLASIMTGLDKEWIERVHVFGFDSNNFTKCELSLRIDWAKYEVHIKAGRTTVEVDDRWSNNTSPELGPYLELFNDFVRNNNLRTRWEVAYRAGLDADEVNRDLGLVRPAPTKWAPGRDGIVNVIPELDEMSVGFWLVT